MKARGKIKPKSKMKSKPNQTKSIQIKFKKPSPASPGASQQAQPSRAPRERAVPLRVQGAGRLPSGPHRGPHWGGP